MRACRILSPNREKASYSELAGNTVGKNSRSRVKNCMEKCTYDICI